MPKKASLLTLVISCISIGYLIWYGPIAQDAAYHLFADQRTMLGLPNFWNVVSNLPFIVVGIFGLLLCKSKENFSLSGENRMAWILLFVGISGTGISSGYYHLQPDNWGLFGDRLTMAVSFMAFFSLVIGAFINSAAGKKMLVPLVLFGVYSVLYWIVSEQQGAGDLRPYIITQFLPMLIIPVIVLVRPSQSIAKTDILIIASGYGLAKLFEHLDTVIYQLLPISGHSLKHLAAAGSAYWLLHILSMSLVSEPARHRKTP